MTPSKRTSQYLAAVKIPVTVLCLFGTALAAYYFFYVTLHQTYLIERNFRLLATIGEHVWLDDRDERFTAGLDTLIDGLQTQRRRRQRSHQPRR